MSMIRNPRTLGEMTPDERDQVCTAASVLEVHAVATAPERSEAEPDFEALPIWQIATFERLRGVDSQRPC